MIEVWNNSLHEKELQNFNRAVINRNIMEGPVLREFEEQLKKILCVDYVVGTSSGTAALALAFMGIGVGPGDEVIVPDLTFIATANAARLLGAEVVVAPVKRGQTLLDETVIENYITDRTKAIVTVDLNGRIAEGKELKEKFAKRGIHIIDDACQAFMSCDTEGKFAGAYADIVCYSFGITKMITTVMGGLVATNNQKIYEKIKILKTQGMPSIFEGDTYLYPGFNFKLPDVLAAIGMGQLERLDQKMCHMCKINKMYREGLSEVEGISFLERKKGEHPWMTGVLCENRTKVRKVLEDNEIISRPLGAPLHTAHYLKTKGEYADSKTMSEKMLYLPGGPDQDIVNIEKVINVLQSHDLK